MRTLTLLFLILASRVIADPYYTVQESGTTNTLRSITFINENTGFAAGNLSTLLRTSNSGNNWVDVDISSSATSYNCVLFANSTTGFVVSDAGELIKSTNAGLNWQITAMGTNALKYIYFLNETTGFVSGDNGTLFKTTNTGQNWMDVSLNISEPIIKIAFSDEDYGYFLTREFLIEGFVYKTTNGGQNWQVVNNFFTGYTGQRALFDCLPLNRDTVYVSLGYYQTGIMRTVNGGQSWEYIYNHFQSAIYPGSFFELFFRDEYIYAFNGPTDGVPCYIVKSSNGGFNFSPYSAYRVFGYMYDVYFFKNSSIGYVCGESGFIVKLHSYVTGINNISTTIPDKFMLKQNYPNPFNPSTKIQFAIPENSEVNLKIYDVLGKEIAVLIDKHLTPGSYEYDFNSRDLPGGVYFYTLTAGSFAETKRMILVK
jgi:photosystem II stability/assembly factor-like uncharacterized protein